MHPFLVVGNVSIPMYFTMIIIGIAIATLVCIHTAKIYKLKKRHIAGAGIFAIIGLILGSKLFYAISLIPELIETWEVVKATPGESLAYAFSGYVFYGGLLGILIALFIYSIQFHQHFYRLSNSFIPSIVLAHAFGRIGCFFAGCCYGFECDHPFGVTFPLDSDKPGLAGTTRFPVQLLESAILFILFIVLFYMANYKKFRKNKKESHPRFDAFIISTRKNLLPFYLISYGIIRFIMEFLRGDTYRGKFGPFYLSQWISLIIIAVCVFVIYRSRKRSADEA
ncbi:MAG: prolipoprotein diacylglyceryl transferase [Parasporobacterium sp.]|nr:prolipoprotein diacylglyceryl transferase [Parasporobacterium sp.]